MTLLTLVPAALLWAGFASPPEAAAAAGAIWHPALPPGLLPAATLTLWAVLMHQAWRLAAPQRALRDWARTLPLALLCGTATAAVALQLLPPGDAPGMAEWGYALPAWQLHAAALAFGLAGAGFAWPLLVLRRARPARG